MPATFILVTFVLMSGVGYLVGRVLFAQVSDRQMSLYIMGAGAIFFILMLLSNPSPTAMREVQRYAVAAIFLGGSVALLRTFFLGNRK